MKIRHVILAAPRNLAMGALYPSERALLSRANDAPPPPVFVVGPPRSGTTLIYEALVGSFRFAYISNLAHRLYRTPVAATKLGLSVIERYEPTYESTWGHISGWGAPNEGGWVWDRWFPEHDVSESGEPSPASTDVMRKTIHAMSLLMRGPFITKNVNHSVWIPYLSRVFPGAIFVEVQRDVVASARSMLKARREDAGERRMHEWMSVKPRHWRRYERESAETQCVAQAVLLRRQIQEDVGALEPVQHVAIPYESFCESPEHWLEQVRWRLLKAGAPIRERRPAPGPFTRHTRSSGDDLDLRLRETADRVERDLRGFGGATSAAQTTLTPIA